VRNDKNTPAVLYGRQYPGTTSCEHTTTNLIPSVKMLRQISCALFLAISVTATPVAEPNPRPAPRPQGMTTIPSAFSTGTKGLPLKTDFDASGGSGPYHAGIFTDAGLKKHTIYAPKTAVTGIKLPLIVWGNGLCAAAGAFFANFLTEVASHGFIVIANGAPGPLPTSAPAETTKTSGFLDSLTSTLSLLSQGMTTASWQAESMDWVFKNNGKTQWGDIDLEEIAAAGQSCGGIERFASQNLQSENTNGFSSRLVIRSHFLIRESSILYCLTADTLIDRQ
jgi:hypothetical protein